MTCAVVEERDQLRLFEVVSHALHTGMAFAVLDPTWPQPFRAKAADQVEAAVSGDVLGPGDMVVFSSGSTGEPRGILRTVESWQASVVSLSQVTGITKEDRVWLPGPLWSSLFLYGAFHARAVGAHLSFRGDDPAAATALHCVPSQIPGLVDFADSGGLPLVRRVVVGGDHLRAPLRQQCEALGWHVVEYYGAAELSFVAWRDGIGMLHAFPGVETELRGGRLWARSPYLARRYLSSGAAGPLRFDSQGWATVGDLAQADSGGLEVLGRGDTAVSVGGHTVIVEEVERLLRRLPGVDDVAVFGEPHARLGQVLTAVIVGAAVDASLRTGVATMPAPSRPRRWLHADELPRTSGGKLRRDALMDLVAKLSPP